MQSTNALGSLSGPGREPPPETRGSNKLGKQEFLRLLMAQLGQQDPTAPVDSQAFIAQLAQFASLELMHNANGHLESLMLAQAAANQTAATQLVGKEILFRTENVTLHEGETARVSARLAGPAENVTVVIVGPSGSPVRTLQVGAREAGALDVEWDGRDDAGNTLPPGDYKVRITASGSDGKPVEVEQRGRGRVSGVSFENGYPELIVGAQKLKLASVVEVNERNVP